VSLVISGYLRPDFSEGFCELREFADEREEFDRSLLPAATCLPDDDFTSVRALPEVTCCRLPDDRTSVR